MSFIRISDAIDPGGGDLQERLCRLTKFMSASGIWLSSVKIVGTAGKKFSGGGAMG